MKQTFIQLLNQKLWITVTITTINRSLATIICQSNERTASFHPQILIYSGAKIFYLVIFLTKIFLLKFSTLNIYQPEPGSVITTVPLKAHFGAKTNPSRRNENQNWKVESKVVLIESFSWLLRISFCLTGTERLWFMKANWNDNRESALVRPILYRTL